MFFLLWRLIVKETYLLVLWITKTKNMRLSWYQDESGMVGDYGLLELLYGLVIQQKFSLGLLACEKFYGIWGPNFPNLILGIQGQGRDHLRRQGKNSGEKVKRTPLAPCACAMELYNNF